jgi:hypothetical protein
MIRAFQMENTGSMPAGCEPIKRKTKEPACSWRASRQGTGVYEAVRKRHRIACSSFGREPRWFPAQVQVQMSPLREPATQKFKQLWAW